MSLGTPDFDKPEEKLDGESRKAHYECKSITILCKLLKIEVDRHILDILRGLKKLHNVPRRPRCGKFGMFLRRSSEKYIPNRS